MTTDNHYDARISRNCDATGTSNRGGAFQTEPSNWGGRTVTGLQKAAGCVYQQAGTPYYSGCEYLAGSQAGCEPSATAWNTYSHATFLRREDGTTPVYWDGGFVQSASS
jgi:hypothetical protein